MEDQSQERGVSPFVTLGRQAMMSSIVGRAAALTSVAIAEARQQYRAAGCPEHVIDRAYRIEYHRFLTSPADFDVARFRSLMATHWLAEHPIADPCPFPRLRLFRWLPWR